MPDPAMKLKPNLQFQRTPYGAAEQVRWTALDV